MTHPYLNLVRYIKMAQKNALISQEAHRQNVMDVSGNRTNTCTNLGVKEQKILLERYKALAPKKPLPKQLKYIYSLWAQLHKKGLVNVNSKVACDNFCARLLKGKTLSQSPEQWSKVIEVLKKWLTRDPKKGGLHG